MLGIHYAELYVADPRDWLRSLRQLGFARVHRTVTDDRVTDVVQRGLVRLLVSTPASVDSPAAAWLAVHGDGVADVAFAVTDLSSALDSAVMAGADVLQCPQRALLPNGQERVLLPNVKAITSAAVIGGAGGVRHTLVETLATPGAPGRAEALDHIALCVPAADLDRVANLYARAFGLTWTPVDRIVIGDGEQAMDSAVLAGPGCTFTLVAPGPGSQRGQLEAFLDASRGAGVQHIAVRVPDIVAEVRRASGQGAQFLPALSAYYDRLPARLGRIPPPHSLDALRSTGVLADTDAHGPMWQIFTRPLKRPSEFFIEFIERRGSQGFGSGNIRALYEAKAAAEAPAMPLPR